MFSDPTSRSPRSHGAPKSGYPVWRSWSDLEAAGRGIAENDSASPPLGLHVDPSARSGVEPDGDAPPGPFCDNHSGDGSVSEVDPTLTFSALDLDDPVVTMLLFKQIVTMHDVDRVWRAVRQAAGDQAPVTLWRALAEDPAVDRGRVYAEAAATAGYSRVHVDSDVARRVMMDHVSAFSERDWKRLVQLGVLPVAVRTDSKTDEDRLVFASHDPSRPEVARLLRQLELDAYDLRYAPAAVIDVVLQGAAEGQAGSSSDDSSPAEPKGETAWEPIFELGVRAAAEPAHDFESGAAAEHTAGTESSGLSLLETCLTAAVRGSATAVHIRPAEGGVRIDLRIDGRLTPWLVQSDDSAETVVRAFKDAAQRIDPDEHDAAQSGVIYRTIDGRSFRFAVSVMPVQGTGARESVAIRIQERPLVGAGLDELGLPDDALDHLYAAVRRGRGLIVVAGPADSGKSETEEALLHELASHSELVVTLEDGVDPRLDALPIRLNPKLRHKDALEAVARHDPDVVVGGELTQRDEIERALLLAKDGHLVFARMAVRDGSAVVKAVTDMGIEPLLTAHALELVLSQRLLRRLCSACKVPATHVDGELLRSLGFTPSDVATASFLAPGDDETCGHCGGEGYDGACLVAEAMPVSKALRRHIALEAADEDDLRQIALREGMQTLRAAARRFVAAGESSVEELIRVAAGEH